MQKSSQGLPLHTENPHFSLFLCVFFLITHASRQVNAPPSLEGLTKFPSCWRHVRFFIFTLRRMAKQADNSLEKSYLVLLKSEKKQDCLQQMQRQHSSCSPKPYCFQNFPALSWESLWFIIHTVRTRSMRQPHFKTTNPRRWGNFQQR